MPLYQVEAPSERVLQTADVKAHLRVDFDDDNDLIDALIGAAEQLLDGRDGYLGRALIAQTWDLKLDAFCGSVIRIPLPPLLEVVSVTYVDALGAEQTLSPDIYQVVGVGGLRPGYIALREGQTWPDTDDIREAVTIQFRAGYRDTSASPAVGEVPQPIQHAMKLMIGHWYENREAVVTDVTAVPLPLAVDALLAPYEVLFLA